MCDTGVADTSMSPLCDACWQCALDGPCAAEVTTCNNTPACTALSTCVNGCAAGDQTCIDNCVNANQAGVTPLLNIVKCGVCSNCTNNCDAANNPNCM